MTKYTAFYRPLRDYDEIVGLVEGEHSNLVISGHSLVVEAEGASRALTVAAEELRSRRKQVPPWVTVERVLEKTRELGVSDEDVLFWFISPTAYWETSDAPYNHFDDSEGVVKAALNHFDQVW